MATLRTVETEANPKAKCESLEAACARLENLAERLGELRVDGDELRKMANIRHLLLGEAFRIRKVIGAFQCSGPRSEEALGANLPKSAAAIPSHATP